MAGSEFGSAMTVEQLVETADLANRPTRERTTTYGRAPVRDLRHLDSTVRTISSGPTG